jgi:hypothetical protein
VLTLPGPSAATSQLPSLELAGSRRVLAPACLRTISTRCVLAGAPAGHGRVWRQLSRAQSEPSLPRANSRLPGTSHQQQRTSSSSTPWGHRLQCHRPMPQHAHSPSAPPALPLLQMPRMRRARIWQAKKWQLLKPSQAWQDGDVTHPHELEVISEKDLQAWLKSDKKVGGWPGGGGEGSG